MNPSLARFPLTSERTEGRPRTLRLIKCSRCERTDTIVDTSPNGLPAEACVHKFRQKGWDVHERRGGALCPDCAAKPVKKKEPEMTTPTAPAADPPREPTPGDRRRIADAIEAHYDTAKRRYIKAFNDANIADQLKMPRAWVSEVRDLMFGPGGNEASEQRDAAIVALERRHEDLESSILALSLKADEIKRAIGELRK